MMLRTLRLSCSQLAVDVRLVQLRGRWVASADTEAGPSLGLGRSALEALIVALEPFDGFRDELLDGFPDELLWR